MARYIATALLLLGCSAACRGELPEFPKPEPSAESGYAGRIPLDFGPFEEALAALGPDRVDRLDGLLLPEGVGVADIRRLLDEGELSSEELVTYYVRRAKEHDEGVFNAVAQLNPGALDDARASDASRGGGDPPRLLEGIPVLVKWNVAVAGLPTTAGAAAMGDWIPSRDAFLVDRLRNGAGAIILGHAQLSEWANYLDPNMPNGFSALGGQARAAYGMYDPFGSSTGSAIAVASGFVPLAVGTETSGSIIMPANLDSVVGLRPSTGLVSGDHVIPLCSDLDTAGPMARSVADLSVLLSGMTLVVTDELKQIDFAQYATMDGAGELLVGIPSFPADASLDPRLQTFYEGEPLDEATIDAFDQYFEEENQIYAEFGRILMDAGVKVTTFDPMDMFLSRLDIDAFLEYCMKDSFDAFASRLKSTEPTFPMTNLEGVVSFNRQDPGRYIPYGQGYLEASVGTNVTADEFERLRNATIGGARAVLDAAFSESGADVILVNGLSQAYSIAGYPALTVPGGYEESFDGETIPVGTVFNAPHLGEAKLIQVGYVYEQATKLRRNPDLESTSDRIGEGLEMRSSAEVLSNEGASNSALCSFCPLSLAVSAWMSLDASM